MVETFDIAATDSALPIWVRRAWPPERAVLHGIGTPAWERPALAIVGSTRPSPIAREWAFRLGKTAAERGWSVVSGLAAGIDSEAHDGAIAAGGHTLAVIAHGIDPKLVDRKRALFSRIINSGGAVVSISEPGEPRTRERLLLRNRWTSAFSLAVVAVQSRGRDGTLGTMRHGFNQSRMLATFPPAPDDLPSAWKGNRLLLSESPPWPASKAQAYPWQPALALRHDGKHEALFDELEALADFWRGIEAGPEPDSHFQAKLLETRERLEKTQ